MTTPEFLVRFSEIKVGLPVPTHGDQVTDKPNPALSPSEEPNNESIDRGLREDGRVYSVALIVAAPEISPGAKLFAQGRVSSLIMLVECAQGDTPLSRMNNNPVRR